MTTRDIPEITDQLVDEAQYRFLEAAGLQDATDEQKARFRSGARALLEWLRARPQAH